MLSFLKKLWNALVDMFSHNEIRDTHAPEDKLEYFGKSKPSNDKQIFP